MIKSQNDTAGTESCVAKCGAPATAGSTISTRINPSTNAKSSTQPPLPPPKKQTSISTIHPSNAQPTSKDNATAQTINQFNPQNPDSKHAHNHDSNPFSNGNIQKTRVVNISPQHTQWSIYKNHAPEQMGKPFQNFRISEQGTSYSKIS